MFPLAILAIEDDDDRAFAEQLYLSYRRLMFSEIQKVVMNEWDTEDIMQNVIERLIDRLDFLRTLDKKHLVNYIITACRNSAYSLLRERKRVKKYSFDEELDFDETLSENGYEALESHLLLQFDHELINQAWRELPADVQVLLSAKYIHKQSDLEIAAFLGIKPSSVRMTLTRARRAFKNQLCKMEQLSNNAIL